MFYSVKEKNFDGRGDQQMSRELNKQKDIEVEMARQREEWVSNIYREGLY